MTIGRIEKNTNEFTEIKWIIDDYFTVIRDKSNESHDSPEFSFENATWCLGIYPDWHGYTTLGLCNTAKREYSIQFNFILKAADDTVAVELTEDGIMNGDSDFASHFLMKFSELQLRKAELVPSNTLTITCSLKRKLVHSNQSRLDKKAPLQLIRLDKLSKNFKDRLDDKETCDTSLIVKNKEFRAHRFVLIARSSVFAANFKHDTLEKQTGVITIEDCDPDSFNKFLEYLYCGKIEEMSVADAFHLYYTSDKYDVEELKAFCVEYLMQCLTAENLCDVAIFADKYEENELFSTVQEFFNTNMSKVFETSGWENLLKNDYCLVNNLLKKMSKEMSKKEFDV